MKLREIIKNLDIIKCNADLETEITGINYDSRQIQPGNIFVAIKGFSSDGHRFIPKAMELGAAVIVCEEEQSEDVPFVLISDSRKSLALMSRDFYANPAAEMTVIGFTGTSGKTSSTYITKHLLEQTLGAKVGLVGTNGNMIGDVMLHTEHTTPESLELHKLFRRMADEGCTHVVMEVSSHSLTLERVAGITFDIGIFTNLSQDHLDLHGTMDEYAAAKRRLFKQCRLGIINMDDERADFMAQGAECELMGYSAVNADASLYADNIELSASGVKFRANYKGEQENTALKIPGMFSVHNALGVLAVGLGLGIDLKLCCQALMSASGVKGRMESVPTDGDYSVIIDYSHKPDALENVLKTLRPVTRGRLITLFGCGGDRDRLKRPIMGRIAAENSDLVIVTSDNPRTEDPMDIINEILPGLENTDTPYKVICIREEAIAWAIDNSCPGDVILLAGKGHEDYQIIGHEKRHLDEREVVADCLVRRKKST